MKPTLPIDNFLPEVLKLLGNNANLVMVAEPGAGKTTRLPPALLKIAKGQVLVLEPRRVAALAAATRIANENNWQLGNQVGYQVRFDNCTQSDTRLIFMTEALLVRRLLSDPELQNVSFIVLDEFHERSLDVDLALGLVRELQEMGRPIQIVVMSATLHAEKISDYLGNAPIVNVPGSLYPLKVHNLEKSPRPALDQNFYQLLIQKIMEVTPNSSGDVLVFLPGVGEIEKTKDRLTDWAQKNNIELQTLHGSQNLEDQNKVLQKSNRKRVILSTNVAESSLTLDGVTTVVDSGLVKRMRFDLNSGFSRLELIRISMSSATQRAGRSARLAPGNCHRLWSRFDETTMKPYDIPEVERSDLSEALLFLAASGLSDFSQFAWFESPPKANIVRATEELQSLKALDTSGYITEHGRELLQLPLPPRLGHFLLLCARHGQTTTGARAVALLQEREILRDPEQLAHLHDPQENDLLYRLEQLDAYSRGGARSYVIPAIAKRVLMSAEKLQNLLPQAHPKATVNPLDLDTIACLAFQNQLCRRRQKSDRARMVGGRGLRLAPESLVKTREFFLPLQAVELGGASETLVSLAYGLDKTTVLQALKNEIVETEDLQFQEEKGQLLLVKQKKFRDLPLEEGRSSPAPAQQSEEQLVQFLLENPEVLEKKNSDFQAWQERWQAYTQACSEEVPPLPLKETFQMASMGCRNLSDLFEKDLTQYLEQQLPSEWLKKFRTEAPSHFKAPTDSQFRIHYPPERAPYVEVRLQELFGIKENPKLLFQTTPLQFHLLGPHYRPVQVTSDIASFWKNTYPEVRKELRARYPKHSWPEDPTTAPAVKKGRSQKK